MPRFRLSDATRSASDPSCASPFRTVTVNVAVAEFPLASVAAHVTVVVAIGNMVPDAGVHASVGAGSTTSVAETANETTAPCGDVAPTVISVAPSMTGGSVSEGGASICNSYR